MMGTHAYALLFCFVNLSFLNRNSTLNCLLTYVRNHARTVMCLCFLKTICCSLEQINNIFKKAFANRRGRCTWLHDKVKVFKLDSVLVCFI